VARLVLLSGHIGSGKSTLAGRLRDRFGCEVVGTRAMLEARLPAGPAPTREQLQQFGASLDSRTRWRWLAEELSRPVGQLADDAVLIVDAVRRGEQVDAIREAFGSRVSHVQSIRCDAPIWHSVVFQELLTGCVSHYRDMPHLPRRTGGLIVLCWHPTRRGSSAT